MLYAVTLGVYIGHLCGDPISVKKQKCAPLEVNGWTSIVTPKDSNRQKGSAGKGEP